MANQFITIIIILLYLVALAIAYKKINIKSFILLFWITFGVFILARPIIGLIDNDYDLDVGTWMYWGVVPEYVIEQSLILIAVFILAFILVSIFIKKNHKIYLEKFNSNLMWASILSMALSFPLYIYRAYSVFDQMQELGYLATFNGDIKTPLVLNIGMGVFQISYYFFLSSFPPKKYFYRVSIFFLIVSLFSLGTGQRIEFASALIFTYWAGYFLKYYQFSFLRLVGIFAGLAPLSILVNALRLGIDVNSNPYMTEALNFLWGQGVSIYSLFGLIENNKIFLPYEGWLFLNKFISCDLLPYINGDNCNNGFLVSAIPGIWWQKLSYYLDKNLFLTGGGLGGNIVSSIYLLFNSDYFNLNLIAFFFFSIIFFLLLYHFDYFYRSKKIILRVYFFYLIQILLFLPRAGFDIFIPHPRMWISALIVLIIYLIFNKTNSEKYIYEN
jgi:hypothetical protein